MRFQRLDIPAYGPFTELRLSFPSNGGDLHVIYGENEAGKSSLLRAIRDLLFGIHRQSPDNFLHDYKNLRLLGEIQNRAGERLIFQRRKGTKNTLLDEAGNPLTDTALLPFLGGVNQTYFSTMFGLGSSELREGAHQLLKGEGEIGSALFSASLGGTPVQHVLDALVAESEQLFKGRATANVSIRPAVNRYKDLLKQSRDSMISADAWDQLTKALNENESSKDRLESEIAGIEREIAWIQRCEDALPSIGLLNEQRRLLGELPTLPEVASDFTSRATAARIGARESSGKAEHLTASIVRLKDQMAQCVRSPQVLAQEDELDALHQGLGTYQTRTEDLTGLQTKLAGIEPALRAGMADLQIPGEPDSLETLRLGSAILMSCGEAVNELGESRRQHEESLNKAGDLKRAIEEQHQEMQSLAETDLEKLRESLSVAEMATEADKTLEASRIEVKSLMRKAADARALIPEAPEELDAAARLSVPSQNTIRIFRERFAQHKTEQQTAERRIREEKTTMEKLRAELDRLERRGELPSEDSLNKAREHRDHGWQLVLADWKGSGTDENLDETLPLEEAFPLAVTRADEIVDRLRRDADVVAQAEEKRFQMEAGQRKIEVEIGAIGELETSTKKCQEEWEEAWKASGLQPRSPEEMEEWRENWVALGDTVRKLRDAEAVLETKLGRIETARSALATALADSSDKAFSTLFDSAKSRVQSGEETNGRRKTLAEQSDKRRREQETLAQNSTRLETKLRDARVKWESQSKEAGLPENISAESGLALLHEQKQLLAKFDAWKQLNGEAAEVREFLRLYEARVQAMAVSLGIEAAGVLAQESALWKALREARETQAKCDQIANQIQSGKSDLEDAKLAEKQALIILQELLDLSRLNTAEELEPLIANLEKQSELQGRLKNLRETLGGLARGGAVDEFIASVQNESAEELPERKDDLGTRKAEKKIALNGVQATLTELHRQRGDFEKAGDAAADFRQQAESAAAALRHDAPRFVRLRMAAHLLQTQIERFREENQGPLLEKSGQCFAAITRGAFAGLAAEFTDRDVPVMTGRRADGTNVPVDGMSEGTRDQLYLALRLAALERHLEEHEPMPLILDDLLITFDDERAKAILSQLAEFSNRTQIFLFTHHKHLLDLCQEQLGEGAYHLHHLAAVNTRIHPI